MAVAIVPIVFIVVGALVYALSANPKAAEIGRLCAMAGFIACALSYASKVVAL